MQSEQSEKGPQASEALEVAGTESRQLADLGKQLRRQADCLASRYPARSASIIASAGPTKTSFGSSHFVALTIAALAIASITPYFWQSKTDVSSGGNGAGDLALIIEQSNSKQLDADPTAVIGGPGVPSNAGAIAVASPDSAQGTHPFDSQAETPVVLLDVSDPELEGLLDLWEQEGSGPTRLSI